MPEENAWDSSEDPVYEEGDVTPIVPRPWFFSASQIETFLACPRKWAWRYIRGIKSPEQPSAKLGTEMHRVLEEYLRDGTPLPLSDPNPLTREAAAIAVPGIKLLPAAQTQGMTLEREFRFENVGKGDAEPILFTGKKDIDIGPATSDSGNAEVWDHKSSSNMERYGKKVEDLLEDPQAILYAYEAMSRHRTTAVEMNWVYYATRGTRRAKRVHLTMVKDHVVPRFLAFRPALVELTAALKVSRPPETFPGDESHCDAYGGCFYLSRCAPLRTNKNPFSRMGR